MRRAVGVACWLIHRAREQPAVTLAVRSPSAVLISSGESRQIEHVVVLSRQAQTAGGVGEYDVAATDECSRWQPRHRRRSTHARPVVSVFVDASRCAAPAATPSWTVEMPQLPASTKTPKLGPAVHDARGAVRRASAAAPCDRAASRSAPAGLAEAVADRAHGLDQVGVLLAELGPQAPDVDVDRAGAAVVLVAPHPREQRLAGEHLAGVRARNFSSSYSM